MSLPAWRMFSRGVFTHVSRLPHRGWMVDLTVAPTEYAKNSITTFEKDLESFQNEYLKEKPLSYWIKVPLSLSHLLASAARAGFVFHNAADQTALLIKWLPKDVPCAVPPFATHQIGVGGLVLNDKGEMLAVKDKHGLFSSWKLPGGLAEVGEDFGETAVREVWEETGVRAQFHSLYGFRHQHGMAWGRSDIYAVCRLRALSEEIKIDTHEIADCTWMGVERFLAESNPNGMIHYLLRHRAHIIDINEATLPSIVYPDKTYKLYCCKPPSA